MIDWLRKRGNRLWETPNPPLWVRVVRIAWVIFRTTNNAELQRLSTTLTYGTLVAIVPLLAVLFTLLKSFGIDAFLRDLVTKALAPMGDAGQDVGNHLLAFVSNAQTGLLGGVGVIFLFYSVFALFRKIEIALNQIWFVPTTNSIKSRLIGYLGALMLLVIVASVALSLNVFFYKGSLSLFDNTPLLATLLPWGAKLLSIGMTAATLALIYTSIINGKVAFGAAFAGGLFCALCWIPLTASFTYLIASSSNYSLIYSSFASVIILLIWLRILWLLFLSGALVTYFVQYPTLLKYDTNGELNPAEQEFFAEQLLHVLIAHFDTGKGPVTLAQLIEKTGLNQKQIVALLAPFLSAKVIVDIGNKNHEYLLAIDKSQIGDAVIKKTIRGKVRTRQNHTSKTSAKWTQTQ